MAANGKAADDGRVTDLANAVNTRLTDLAPPFAISDITGLQAELDAPKASGGFRKWWPGWYYGPPAADYAQRLSSASTGTQYWVPLWVPKTVDVDRISLTITNGVPAGPTVTLMIFNSDANDFPKDLVLTAGTIDPTSDGVKIITIDQTLTRGMWWLSMHTTDLIKFRGPAGSIPGMPAAATAGCPYANNAYTGFNKMGSGGPWSTLPAGAVAAFPTAAIFVRAKV